MTAPSSEQPARETPLLDPNEVHVWSVQLQPRQTDDHWTILSPDERWRADRFRFALDRNRFVAARSLLRQLLGHYVDSSPRDIQFDYAEQGKPYIRGSNLRFNLSHSGGIALYAVTVDREVGVDLESSWTQIDLVSILQRGFSARERSLLTKMKAGEREHAALIAWVRKEAVAKALGVGLGFPLHLVETEPGAPAQAYRVGLGSGHNWFLWDVPIDGDYVGALAAPDRHLWIRWFRALPDNDSSSWPFRSVSRGGHSGG